jgi:hypothetical protein
MNVVGPITANLDRRGFAPFDPNNIPPLGFYGSVPSR